jgi:hypothetical protein
LRTAHGESGARGRFRGPPRGVNVSTARGKGLLEQTRNELRAAKERAKGIRKELRAATGWAERRELKKRRRAAEQEIVQLENELRTVKHQRAGDLISRNGEADDGTGALPDFAIIGQRRSGTTFLYHLLTLHPHVRRAAKKEPHFFGVFFDEGVEWYRRCFPAPRRKGGRMTITGEATPLMANRLAPERMASVIPNARLIALLRNPVDRTYSDYRQVVGKGRESRPFEEAIGLKDDGPDEKSPYVMRSVYVDQLQHWSEYFSKEQMLVLKSEELYESPVETLNTVIAFLDLPEWEPKASQLPKRRNTGSYEGGMESSTRERLEEYFRPHNRRLYEYLGRDFGW